MDVSVGSPGDHLCVGNPITEAVKITQLAT